LAYALAARVSEGAEASKKSCPEAEKFVMQRRFFATSESLTAAILGTLGLKPNIFKKFSISYISLVTATNGAFPLIMNLLTAGFWGT
jgi:hypothetical protein